jgi:hypothetical protein
VRAIFVSVFVVTRRTGQAAVQDQRISLQIKQCKEKIIAAKRRIMMESGVDDVVKLRATLQKEEVIAVASLCKSVPSFCKCVPAAHSRDLCSETKPCLVVCPLSLRVNAHPTHTRNDCRHSKLNNPKHRWPDNAQILIYNMSAPCKRISNERLQKTRTLKFESSRTNKEH